MAVDPDVIPLGTKLYVKSNVAGIPDYGYCIAWDVGGSIKDMRIDLFRCVLAERLKWIGAFIRGNGWTFSASDRRKVSDRIS